MSRSHLARIFAGLLLAAAGAVALVWGAATPTPAASRATVTLTIAFDDGQGDRSTARLTCRGATAKGRGYLHGRPRTACRQARKIARFLASNPERDMMCTQIFGGPETARIRGKIGSREIDRRFARSDGCEIADWERAGVLLPRSDFNP